ncbi:MAG TPA: hypothetical protein VG168_13030 [Bryobacteraceae bacterium]|nr:hypothetical protein [Bryobacteraceae bacterium]
MLPLLAQVTYDVFDSQRHLGGVQLRLGLGSVPGNLFFDRRIELAQGARRFGGFAQEVAAPETGEIVGSVVKAELMDSAMRAENLQVSVLEFGIHLHNRAAVIGILIRIHLEKALPNLEIKELQEGPTY